MQEPKKTSGRGGARPGAGRPRIGTKCFRVRLMPEQYKKMMRLGGSKWLRALIEKAVK